MTSWQIEKGIRSDHVTRPLCQRRLANRIAEGIVIDGTSSMGHVFTVVEHYRSLWDSINDKKYPWESNPWVWVVEFKVEEK